VVVFWFKVARFDEEGRGYGSRAGQGRAGQGRVGGLSAMDEMGC
jgi:hypothetical protein